MKKFWKIFVSGIPLALGIVCSLIAILYVTEIGDGWDEVSKITAAIFWGVIGFPLILASSIRIIDKYKKEM